MEELVAVLRRPKFSMQEDEIHRAVMGIVQISELVTVKSKFDVVKEDPADNVILNTACDSDADYIVSGDSHLLGIGEFRGISIVSVDGMLRILKAAS